MQQGRRDFLASAVAAATCAYPITTPAQGGGLGNPRLPRELQLQFVDQVNVFSFLSDSQIADVRSGNAGMDVTEAVQACLDSVAGKRRTVHFPPGTYLMGRVFPRSHTILWMNQDTVLRKKTGGISLIRIAGVENVHVFANGARLDASAPDPSSSHTVYFDSARSCSIRHANVTGAGAAKDCIYVGEGSQGPSLDVLILGGSCAAARRNGISVVSGLRTVIDGVEIHGTTGAPGAGIDVESNVYDRARDTEIRNCRIHGNRTYGIVVVFGDGVKIHHNAIFGNLQDGIGGAAGGLQFKPGVYRPNVDVRGIARFDPTTGRIHAGGRADSLPIGTVILFNTSNDAMLPATFRGSRGWIVNEVRETVGGGIDVLLASALDHDVKTQLSDAGSGRMSTDPASSDIRMVCHVTGQCSDIEIYENRIEGNLRRGISMITAVDVTIRDNRIRHGGSMSAIQVSYGRQATIQNNVIEHDGSTGGTGGILVGTSTSVATKGNRVTGFPDSGIEVGNASRTRMDGDTVLNCGTRNGVPVRLRSGTGLRVAKLRISNDDRHPSTFGLRTETVTGSVFSEVDASGTGNSNSNSINVGDNQIVNSRVKDGSVHSTRAKP